MRCPGNCLTGAEAATVVRGQELVARDLVAQAGQTLESDHGGAPHTREWEVRMMIARRSHATLALDRRAYVSPPFHCYIRKDHRTATTKGAGDHSGDVRLRIP